MDNDITSIQFRENLVKEIKILMLDKDFPFDNISVFVAIASELLKQDWNDAKNTGHQNQFKIHMKAIIDKLKRREIISEKPRGVQL